MIHRVVLIAVVALSVAFPVEGQLFSIAGDLRSYATLHSIGLEWDVVEDDDHDAACALFFREVGETAWISGLDLFRVDFVPPDPVAGLTDRFNGFAGSVLFLSPGTVYEVRLVLTDPDGGSEPRETAVSTRSEPAKPAAPVVYHVEPGTGGGSGGPADPFQGIAAAQVHASPGVMFLLHAGVYDGFDSGGEILLDSGGDPTGYVVWQPAGDGEVVFEDPLRIAADSLWVEDIHVRGHPEIASEWGVRTYNAPRNVVISRCLFTDYHYSIALNHGGENWWIVNNTIIGDKDVIGTPDGPESYSGEGIELNHTSGHTVAHNSISRVADGVSYPLNNTDIFGNEIFDVTDDGIEPDYGYANIRMWANRVSNARHAAISFQPMNSGPWYVLRNQVVAGTEALKLRETSRALIAHNTFVGWEGVQGYGSENLLSFHSLNNLWISVQDRYAWENGVGGSPTWRTRLDNDGFDWGDSFYAFKWGADARFVDLASFSAATGLEASGHEIDRDTCFTTFDVPAAPPESMPFQYMALKGGAQALDVGVLLPTVNDGFIGSAPDLGAYERGGPLPWYGPKPDDLLFFDGFETADTSVWSLESN